jgi:NADPH:quinone reductase-like Zn-dependent oxidoreductase
VTSYADREWLTAGAEVPSTLSFDVDGKISWHGHEVGRLPEGADPTIVAAGALLRVARGAAAAAAEHGPGTVDVLGAGLVAAHARRLTRGRAHEGESAPTVVVDTTGDPEMIRSALDRVADRGMVVLAGEASGRELDLDVYSSIHRRGLVVVGVTSPSESSDATESWFTFGEDELAASREALGRLSTWDEPLSAGSLWFRIES